MFSFPILPVESLYVHVPFCAQKCSYCAFYSEASQGEVVNRYVDALVLEMGYLEDDFKPRTIFFGGGTPSLLNLRQWERVLAAMHHRGWTAPEEWTVECNPATVSLDKAKLLRSAGVNRISMGVQSLDEGLLDRLGRVHDRSMVFKSYETLRQAGFDNINLDLMFAIPGQTLEIWDATLHEAIGLGPDHLSCYEVIYEEDTPLYKQLQAGEIDEDEELACTMHEELIDVAGQHGFFQYEIANFARHRGSLPVSIPDRAAQHNINYWRGGQFHALGPSAAGFLAGIRTKNKSNTQIYCEELEQGRRPLEWQESLAPIKRAGEIAAFGLRMNAGWPFKDFSRVTGFDLRADWSSEIKQVLSQGWAEQTADTFRLNRTGLRFADSVAQDFLKS